MGTQIAHTSKGTISRLIRNEFDNIDIWNIDKSKELILTAKTYGLDELAEEMENDLK